MLAGARLPERLERRVLAVLDRLASIALAATPGLGVALSALSVLVFTPGLVGIVSLF